MVVYVTPVFAPRWGFFTAGENPTVEIKQGVLRATSANGSYILMKLSAFWMFGLLVVIWAVELVNWFMGHELNV